MSRLNHLNGQIIDLQCSRNLDYSPSLEGEADGEDGAEEHREPDDEGEDDGVLTFHVQRSGEVCEGCNIRDIEEQTSDKSQIFKPAVSHTCAT